MRQKLVYDTGDVSRNNEPLKGPMVQTIFHAHNWRFARVLTALADLQRCGYDAVQLSPAQKSAPGDAWFLRYQPYDHLQIEGLGSRDELAQLCAVASQHGITIIADVVFNHMAIPRGAQRADWLTAIAARERGNEVPMAALYAKLEQFPHLSSADFAPWRDMQGADWDNEQRYESWGNGEWPELRPTANVLRLHKQHLRLLYECGVRGFRFDAVKHMRVSHLREYMQEIATFAEPCWCYGEVFSDQLSMQREYAPLFPTTDFLYITKLKQLLRQPLPQQIIVAQLFLDERSIRFGMNHDLACNPPHLVEGFLFATPEQTRLANCLALLVQGGAVLVYAEDHQHDPLLRACVAWRGQGQGLSGTLILDCRDGKWSIAGSSGGLTLDMRENHLSPL